MDIRMPVLDGVDDAGAYFAATELDEGTHERLVVGDEHSQPGFRFRHTWSSLMQQGRLILPRHPALLAQLAALEFETTESGTVRIAVPERAGHDDLAMALCLTAHHQAPLDARPHIDWDWTSHLRTERDSVPSWEELAASWEPESRLKRDANGRLYYDDTPPPTSVLDMGF